MTLKYLTLVLITLVLTACSSSSGRYSQKYDSKPTRLPTKVEMEDPVPRAEEKSKGGNRHYTVLGKSYKVLPHAEGFTQTGTASWYGKKFHGHLTANGEIYNMFSMSAAHKSLPLPSYVKVTNLANNKTAIVRVNDRGPFHQSRIIDLSYSAAYKLDMLKTGTANVKIEAITNFEKSTPIEVLKNKGLYIQVFATKRKEVANNKSAALTSLYKAPAKAHLNNGIYRVKLGPLSSKQHQLNLLSQLKSNGYPEAFALSL